MRRCAVDTKTAVVACTHAHDAFALPTTAGGRVAGAGASKAALPFLEPFVLASQPEAPLAR